MSIRTKLHPMGGGLKDILFIRPNLTANNSAGSINQNGFYVVSEETSTSSNTYKAFDNDLSSYYEMTGPSSGSSYSRGILIYNSKPLKVTNFDITYTTTSRVKTLYYIYGSNTYPLSISNITVLTNNLASNSQYFKYYQIGYSLSKSQNVAIINIAITATYKG